MAHGFTFDWADINIYNCNVHLLQNEIDDYLIKSELQPTIWFSRDSDFPFRTTRNNTIGNHRIDDFVILVHEQEDLTLLKTTYPWTNGTAFFIDDKLWGSIIKLTRASSFSLHAYHGDGDFANWVSEIADKFTPNPRDDIDTVSEALYRWGNFFHQHRDSIKDHLNKKALLLQRQFRRELRKQFPKEKE